MKWMRRKTVSLLEMIRSLGSSLLLAIGLMFSGEEAYGKYVDLYTNHTAYNNLKNITKRLSYLQYLDALLAAEVGTLHAEFSKDVLRSKDYESYAWPYFLF